MDWTPELTALGRVGIAAVLGVLIGFERERHDHPAGTRTFAAVAVGAALFGVVSTMGFDEFAARRAESNFQVDVTRVASQVVVGIGFLGAGVIFRQGGTVQNLTTAATLWTTAAVGLAAGVGEAAVAVVVAGGMLVLLAALPVPLEWLLRAGRGHQRHLSCTLVPAAESGRLRRELADAGVTVRGWELTKDAGRVVVDLRLGAAGEADLELAVERLVASELVESLQVVD